MGRFEEAESLLKRSLEILDANHQDSTEGLGVVLSELAGVYQATGRKDLAWKLQERLLQIKYTGLQDVFSFSSEAGMHTYFNTMNGVLPNLLTMALEAKNPEAATDALTWTLRLKGITFDTLCRYRRAQHSLTAESPITAQLSKYQSLKQMLADAALNPTVGLTAEQSVKRLDNARKEAEALEAELSRSLTGTHAADQTEPPTAAKLQERLPTNAVYVEFVRAPLRDFKATTVRWSEHHYLALVLRPERQPARLFDLGPAGPIDAGVDAVRKEFTDFQEKLKDCEKKKCPAETGNSLLPHIEIGIGAGSGTRSHRPGSEQPQQPQPQPQPQGH